MLAETFLIMTVLFIAVLGPAIVIAVMGYAVIKALSRNPSAATKIFFGVILMLVFVVSISVVAVLVIFQLFSK